MKIRIDRVEPVLWTAWGATIFAVASLSLQSREIELQSEIICCTFLLILSHVVTPERLQPSVAQPFALSWISATSAAIASLCFAEANSFIFFPLLCPLFAILTWDAKFDKDLGRTKTSPFSFKPPTVGSISTALCCVAAIYPARIHDMVLSGVANAALIIILLIQLRSASARDSSDSHSSMFGTMKALALRINTTLCCGIALQTMLYGYTHVSIASVALLGSVKAFSWYCSIILAERVSWTVVPSIWTYAIMCTRAYSPQHSRWESCLHLIGCISSLNQLVQTIPKSFSSRTKLRALFVVALAPYLATEMLTVTRRPDGASKGHLQTHPVELLIRNANVDFENFVMKQSQNFDAASEEYRRRYGMKPPEGFQSWYNFAKLHDSVVIDDFDTMYQGIAPFWKLTGQEFVGLLKQLKQLPNNELWSCDFSGPSCRANCVHAFRRFDRHIGSLLDLVPEDLRRSLTNVSFLVNHLDEPRVVLPPSMSSDGVRNGLSLNQIDLKHTACWNILTESCIGSVSQSVAPNESSLPFVSNTTANADLCSHDEYKSMHGLFLSPTSLAIIEGLAPVLSTGALSTMGDILFPSPAYIEPEFRYDEANDCDWAQKKNNLYWAGSTSGGYAGKMWQQFHRQRFVSFVRNLSKGLFHLREHESSFTRVASSLFDTRLYDVMFTRVYQCERKYCREQDMFFNPGTWAGKDEAFKSRLVFDLDGNGISGRYHKLLASKSAPLKQTLFREWHDDRLAPWVHYIPVSQHMDELPELISFLASTELGQRRAREIAEQGQQWASRALREIDIVLYVYRLLLEIARLQDIHRDKLA